MVGKSSSLIQSSKVRGILWLIAAFLMIIGPVLTDGNKGPIGVGFMFLVFGLVALSRGSSEDKKTSY